MIRKKIEKWGNKRGITIVEMRLLAKDNYVWKNDQAQITNL